MKDYGFFKCKSSAQVLEILERLPIEEITNLVEVYGCSGSELAERILKGMRTIEGLSKRQAENLSDSQIDNVLITLKQKEIDEQVRSNKVVEGVLKDIQFGINMIASSLSDINIRQELKYTFNERDIMNGSGIAEQGGGDVLAEAQKNNVEISADSLADISDLMQRDSKELVNIADAVHLIESRLQRMMSEVRMMNARQQNIAARVHNLVSNTEAEKPEPEAEIVENEQGDTPDQEKS